jgi:hypothetical protein
MSIETENEMRWRMIDQLDADSQPRLLEERLFTLYSYVFASKNMAIEKTYVAALTRFLKAAQTDLIEALWPNVSKRIDVSYYAVCKHVWKRRMTHLCEQIFLDLTSVLPPDYLVKMIHASVLFACAKIYEDIDPDRYHAEEQSSSCDESDEAPPLPARRVANKRTKAIRKRRSRR